MLKGSLATWVDTRAARPRLWTRTRTILYSTILQSTILCLLYSLLVCLSDDFLLFILYYLSQCIEKSFFPIVQFSLFLSYCIEQNLFLIVYICIICPSVSISSPALPRNIKLSVSVCIHMYIYIYTYVYMYVCIYIYIYKERT